MGDDFDASWSQIQSQLVALVVAGQLSAARLAEPYLVDVLAETGQPDSPVAALRVRGFAGTAADGRPLADLLRGAVIDAKQARAEMSTADSLARGGRWLDMVTQTTIADTARSAVTAGITVRPDIDGYVRSTGGAACSRCAVMSGKFFRYNAGFLRHPRCNCVHTPTSRHLAGDFTETVPAVRRADLTSLDFAARFNGGRRMPEQIVMSTDNRTLAIATLRRAGFVN